VDEVYPKDWLCTRGRIRAVSEANLLPIGLEPITCQDLVEGIEGSAEGGAAPGAVQLRPEEVDEAIAGVAFSGDGQVGQEGDGFAPVHFDRQTVTLNLGWAEQVEGQVRHPITSVAASG
jgi:hypothetical protein